MQGAGREINKNYHPGFIFVMVQKCQRASFLLECLPFIFKIYDDLTHPEALFSCSNFSANL